MIHVWFSKLCLAALLLFCLFTFGCGSKMAPVPNYSTMTDDGVEARVSPTQSAEHSRLCQDLPVLKIQLLALR
ncbi:MAG: hypothetical protein AAGA30_14310 [Planctomycetota bacterium]